MIGAGRRPYSPGGAFRVADSDGGVEPRTKTGARIRVCRRGVLGGGGRLGLPARRAKKAFRRAKKAAFPGRAAVGRRGRSATGDFEAILPRRRAPAAAAASATPRSVTHPRTHARTHARTHSLMRARTHALMHALTCARTHSHTHASPQACTHSRTQARTPKACTHSRCTPRPSHALTHPRQYKIAQ